MYINCLWLKLIIWLMRRLGLNITIYNKPSCFLSSSVILFHHSFVFFHSLALSDCACETLGHGNLWSLPAQVPVTPALPQFSQSHWSWLPWPPLWWHVSTAGPPAQSLSHPIYLTQTTDHSQPSPAYLGSAWFSVGIANILVPLQPGNSNETWGGGPLGWVTSVVFEWECDCWAICQVLSVEENSHNSIVDKHALKIWKMPLLLCH